MFRNQREGGKSIPAAASAKKHDEKHSQSIFSPILSGAAALRSGHLEVVTDGNPKTACNMYCILDDTSLQCFASDPTENGHMNPPVYDFDLKDFSLVASRLRKPQAFALSKKRNNVITVDFLAKNIASRKLWVNSCQMVQSGLSHTADSKREPQTEYHSRSASMSADVDDNLPLSKLARRRAVRSESVSMVEDIRRESPESTKFRDQSPSKTHSLSKAEERAQRLYSYKTASFSIKSFAQREKADQIIQEEEVSMHPTWQSNMHGDKKHSSTRFQRQDSDCLNNSLKQRGSFSSMKNLSGNTSINVDKKSSPTVLRRRHSDSTSPIHHQSSSGRQGSSQKKKQRNSPINIQKLPAEEEKWRLPDQHYYDSDGITVSSSEHDDIISIEGFGSESSTEIPYHDSQLDRRRESKFATERRNMEKKKRVLNKNSSATVRNDKPSVPKRVAQKDKTKQKNATKPGADKYHSINEKSRKNTSSFASRVTSRSGRTEDSEKGAKWRSQAHSSPSPKGLRHSRSNFSHINVGEDLPPSINSALENKRNTNILNKSPLGRLQTPEDLRGKRPQSSSRSPASRMNSSERNRISTPVVTDAAEWTRLLSWLHKINMEKYAIRFRQGGVNKLSVVELLRKEDLSKMKVNAHDIPTIMDSIREISRRTLSYSESVSSPPSSPSSPQHSSLKRQKSLPTSAPSSQSDVDILQSLSKRLSKHTHGDLSKGAPSANASPPEKSAPISPETKAVLTAFDEGADAVFFSRWDNLLPQIEDIQSAEAKSIVEEFHILGFYCTLYFAIRPILANQSSERVAASMNKFKKYLEGLRESKHLPHQKVLMNSRLFAAYAGIVMVQDPTSNPAYAPLFEPQWRQTVRQKVYKFLLRIRSNILEGSVQEEKHTVKSPEHEIIKALDTLKASKSTLAHSEKLDAIRQESSSGGMKASNTDSSFDSSRGKVILKPRPRREFPKSGYLRKQVKKGWKKRYFHLDGISLAYYLDDTLSEKKGELFLNTDCVISAHSLPEASNDQEGCIFKVEDPSMERIMTLCAPDSKSKDLWVKHLLEAVESMGSKSGAVESKTANSSIKSSVHRRVSFDEAVDPPQGENEQKVADLSTTNQEVFIKHGASDTVDSSDNWDYGGSDDKVLSDGEDASFKESNAVMTMNTTESELDELSHHQEKSHREQVISNDNNDIDLKSKGETEALQKVTDMSPNENYDTANDSLHESFNSDNDRTDNDNRVDIDPGTINEDEAIVKNDILKCRREEQEDDFKKQSISDGVGDVFNTSDNDFDRTDGIGRNEETNGVLCASVEDSGVTESIDNVCNSGNNNESSNDEVKECEAEVQEVESNEQSKPNVLDDGDESLCLKEKSQDSDADHLNGNLKPDQMSNHHDDGNGISSGYALL